MAPRGGVGDDRRMRAALLSPASARRRGAVRVSGLAVLLGIVVVGLATGAGFYRWKRGEMDARVAAQLAEAPESPAERVALWLRLGGGPQIHHRLAVVGRFAPDMPWLVTHARALPEDEGDAGDAGGAHEIWGVDCATLPQDLARVEGLTVVVALPAPRPLGRVDLAGEPASRVPVLAPGEEVDAAARLAALALHLLEDMPQALERDIPGARIEIRVADAAR
jgi:hypothetical protein